MATRTVAFPRPLVFEVSGNIYKNAITFGDVDNDGLDELIVGNDAGRLFIYKGTNTKPVRVCTNLGVVAVVAVGDLLNIDRNVLVVCSASGETRIYDFKNDKIRESDEGLDMRAIHVQKLPANIKCALIGDINGDGFNEAAFGLTDRIVRTYKWVKTGDVSGDVPCGKLVSQSKWELSEQIGSMILKSPDGAPPTLLVSQPGATCFNLNPPADDKATSDFDNGGMQRLNKNSIEYESLDSSGCINALIQTEICGGIDLNEETSFDHFKIVSSAPRSGTSYLDCELPTDNCGYVLGTVDGGVMLYRDKKMLWKVKLGEPIISVSTLKIPQRNRFGPRPSLDDTFGSTDDDSSQDDFPLPSSSPIPIFPFNYRRTPTKSIPISNPPTPSKGFGRTSAAAASAAALRSPKKNKKRKDDGEVSMVTKIIACTPEGTTYIMNALDETYCKYHFHGEVNTFATGFYGVKGKQNPCIAYVCFDDKIYVYYQVSQSLATQPNITDLLLGHMDYIDAVKSLGIDVDDREQLRHLNNYLMHGFRNFPALSAPKKIKKKVSS